MYVFQEIVDDTGNGDIVNIEFIPFYKKKKEVKGSFKLWQLDLVRGIIH